MVGEERLPSHTVNFVDSPSFHGSGTLNHTTVNPSGHRCVPDSLDTI